jgi:hypothetical protein
MRQVKSIALIASSVGSSSLKLSFSRTSVTRATFS